MVTPIMATAPYCSCRLGAEGGATRINPEKGTLDLLLAAANATNDAPRCELAMSFLQDLEPPVQRALEVLRQHLTELPAPRNFGVAMVQNTAYDVVDLERTLAGIHRIDPANREGVAILLAALQRQRVDERVNSAAVLARVYPEEPAGIAALAAIVREEPESFWRIFAANELRRAGPAAKAAIPALKAATRAADPAVRLAARRALKAIEGGNPK